MSNTLGTFSVDLVAKIAQFESGWDKAAHIAKKQGEQIRATVAQMGTAIVASVGAAAAAVTAIVNQAINTGAMFDDMSQKLGVTAEWLSVMKREAKLGGVELTALQASLVKLDKAAVAAANGSKEQAAAFKAMGISVVDSNGKLKDTGTLFNEVAVKMSGYRDGTSKTVLATELLGKTGAELMPLLNGLGEKGFAVARKEAEALGLVMSGPAAAAAGKFQDNLDDMRALLEGFGVQIVNQIIQPLAEYSGKLLDGAKANKDFGGSVDIVSTAIKAVIVGASLVKNSIEAVTNVILALYDTTKAVFIAVGQAAGVWGESVSKQIKAVLSFDYEGAVAAGKEGREKLAAVMRSTATQIKASWATAGDGITESINDVSLAMDLFAEHAAKPGDAAKKAAEEAAKADAPWRDHASAQKEAADQAKQLAAAQDKLLGIISGLKGGITPTQRAWEAYANSVMDAAAAGAAMIKNGADVAMVQRLVAQATDLATKARERELAAIKRQGDVLGRYNEQLAKDRQLLGLTDRQRAIAEAVQRATDEYEENTRAGIENAQSLEQLRAAVAASEGAFYDQSKAIEAAQAEAQRYADIVRGAMESAIDSLADWAVNGFRHAKDFWRGMVDLVKNAVKQMIAEGLKARIIGAFTGTSGGGAGWAQMLGGAASYAVAGGGASGYSGAASAASSGASQATGGFSYGAGSGGGGGFDLFSAASWVRAGKNLYQGFSSFAYGSGQTTWLGSQMGVAAYGPGMTTTYTPTGAGLYAGYAAGLTGAYYGFTQRGNGGLSSAAAGLSYGALGLGVAGAVGGVASGAGAVAGATGAFASLGSAAWIPVVGWILAILAVIDIAAGGLLFGTRRRTEYAEQRYSIGPGGSSSELALTKVRQRSLFGGRDWTTYTGAGTPEMNEAAAEFQATITKAMQRVADATGRALEPMIEATLITSTKYDKRGKPLGTNYVARIGGVDYQEESAELAAARIQAEAIFKQLGEEAQRLAAAYRGEVETLVDAAATMVQAQVDLNKGNGLLGAGNTLTSVVEWLEQQRQEGEQLSETYTRLAQASAQYRALLQQVDETMAQLRNTGGPVEQLRSALQAIDKQLEQNIATLNAAAQAAGLQGAAEADLMKLRQLAAEQTASVARQFWGNIDQQLAELTHVATPAGDFAAVMQAIAQSMNDNIAQATMLARAQGRAGITTEELAKITELAARQMGAAIKKLQDIARQQAQSLGYIGPQTVGEIDARIEELEGIAAAAADSVGGFGSAMSAVAQEATNAINLLLGNLSPLNDQAKLQVALSGLYAGNVTQQEVLEIGRRLYASSAQYTALFNQVMAAVRPAIAAGSGSGAMVARAARQLTSAEEAELRDLRLRREAAVQQQRFNEASQFAITIATLADAQGRTFEQIASNIGFDLGQLADDLGMSQDDLLKYLAGIDVTQLDTTEAVTTGFNRLIAWLDEHFNNTINDRGGSTDRQTQAIEGVRDVIREGRDAASRDSRAIVAAIDRVVSRVDQLEATTNAGIDITAPRNVRYGIPP